MAPGARRVAVGLHGEVAIRGGKPIGHVRGDRSAVPIVHSAGLEVVRRADDDTPGLSGRATSRGERES